MRSRNPLIPLRDPPRTNSAPCIDPNRTPRFTRIEKRSDRWLHACVSPRGSLHSSHLTDFVPPLGWLNHGQKTAGHEIHALRDSFHCYLFLSRFSTMRISYITAKLPSTLKFFQANFIQFPRAND